MRCFSPVSRLSHSGLVHHPGQDVEGEYFFLAVGVAVHVEGDSLLEEG